MGEDVVSESEDLEISVDDLVRTPLGSAQNTLFQSSRLVGSNRDSRPVQNPFFNRSAPHPEAARLDVMEISSAAMSRMFQGLKSDMISEMKRIGEAQVAEIRKVGTAVSEAVAYDLHGLVEMISGGAKTNGTVRTGGKTTLSDWEKKLDALTPYVNAIFEKKLLSRILCYNVPVKCVGIYQKYEKSGMSDVERASLSAQTIMFSLQPRDKKYQYSGDVGQLHSDFKFSVVQNSFFNVQRDTFRLFKVEGSVIDDGRRLGAVNAAVLPRPSWLGEGKVLMDHINQARSFIETAGQTRNDKIRRSPTADNIACHGALRVYRQLGARLHDGRGSLRFAFFVGVGYLLVPWKDRIAEFDQSSVELNMEEEDLVLSLEDIPYTAQCTSTDDSVTVNVADAKYKELLRKLFADCPAMILTAVHDVKVTKGNTETSKRGKHGERRESLHRVINLIDVACGCCVEFCGAESREVFLRTHKSSLQYVMLFALLFKAFYLEVLAMRSESSSAASTVPEPTYVKVFGSCLKDFIPGLHTQRSILSQKWLHMTQNSFEMLNHPDANTYDSADEAADTGGVFDMHHMKESAEHGI